MDWSNEPYVKVYTRETDDDLALSWEARALWDRLITKFDRSGFVETRRGVRGLAAITRIPLPVIEHVLPELLSDGRLVAVEGGFLAPNYIAAQEASKSDKLRQKDARDRRRARALNHNVTNRDGAVTERDSDITTGHAASRGVTLCSADPDPLQNSAEAHSARAIPPSTEYDPASADHRYKLAWSLFTDIADARDKLIAELGLNDIPMGRGGSEPRGMRDLRDRVREEGEVAPQACAAVFATLLRQAREERSVEWLSEKAFTEGGWRHARNDTTRRAPRSAPRGETPVEKAKRIAREEGFR